MFSEISLYASNFGFFVSQILSLSLSFVSQALSLSLSFALRALSLFLC